MDNAIKKDISSLLRIQVTEDLGIYLGIPLLHTRTTKKSFQFIIDKVRNKLTGWDACKLSLVGRITLAQSVMSAIPIYFMQSAFLPASVCEEVDKMCRNFIWGNLGGQRKTFLVSWNKITCPKELGGLGFRDSRTTNKAFMMKIAWGIVNNINYLWVKVLRAKYKLGDNLIPEQIFRKNCSNLWKGVMGVWTDFLHGLGWSIGTVTLFDFGKIIGYSWGIPCFTLVL